MQCEVKLCFVFNAVLVSCMASNPCERSHSCLETCELKFVIYVHFSRPQIACRLIGHKIQSPQEREALQALIVAEACVKNCGEAFHREVGKFRFLNELIKLISPKVRRVEGIWNSVKLLCISLVIFNLTSRLDPQQISRTQGLVLIENWR